MRSEDAPVRWAAFSVILKPGNFLGSPGFLYVQNRGSPLSFLPHQQKPDDSDCHQENVAYSVYGVCIHGQPS